METIPREHYNLYYIFLEEREKKRLPEEIVRQIWMRIRAACDPPPP